MTDTLHPATSVLIDRFAQALKEKLAKAEAKYGYSDGWLDKDWQGDLVAKLAEHVQKGDPRDVAAYCAFAWHHGWSITPPDTGDVAALRERIARIIDPKGWEFHDRHKPNPIMGAEIVFETRPSLATADEILAAPTILAALSKPNAPGRE